MNFRGRQVNDKRLLNDSHTLAARTTGFRSAGVSNTTLDMIFATGFDTCLSSAVESLRIRVDMLLVHLQRRCF
jgi:hypothetical protein